MAEIILAVLCILFGIGFAFVALLVLWGNAMGGVTNASAVNNRPAIVFAILAIAGVGGGISILVF
jgi:hypothetical protein